MAIITNADKLRVISQISDVNNIKDVHEICEQLLKEVTDDAFGLAAPQIGIFNRIFFARVACSKDIIGHIFVNPQFDRKFLPLVPSVESCLSLPGVVRCVERHQQVVIKAELILKVVTRAEIMYNKDFNLGITESSLLSMRLKYRESFVVQHEYDHLQGVLIVDLAETDTKEHRIEKRLEKKERRIAEAREVRRAPKVIKKFSKKISANKSKLQKKKEKKIARKERKRQQMTLEIQERYLAKQQGIL